MLLVFVAFGVGVLLIEDLLFMSGVLLGLLFTELTDGGVDTIELLMLLLLLVLCRWFTNDDTPTGKDCFLIEKERKEKLKK